MHTQFMKPTKIFSLIALLLIASASIAQTDEERSEIAKTYMDKVTKKNKSYSTINTSFTLTIDNKQQNTKTNHKGSLLTKGNKYRLNLMDNITYFDGTTVCTWLVNDKEANISDVDETSESVVGPLQLTSSVDKKYKMRYLQDTKVNTADCVEIDLYPIDRKTNITRVRLTIDKKSYAIRRIMQQGKDGTSYYVDITTFTTNENVADKEFTFDKSAHPDVEIVDLR